MKEAEGKLPSRMELYPGEAGKTETRVERKRGDGVCDRRGCNRQRKASKVKGRNGLKVHSYLYP